MARSVRKAALPADVREHLEYPEPKQFSGVEWRDFADLRERVARLEQHRDGSDRAASGRTIWWAAIVGAAIGSAVSALVAGLLVFYWQQPGQVPVQTQQQELDQQAADDST